MHKHLYNNFGPPNIYGICMILIVTVSTYGNNPTYGDICWLISLVNSDLRTGNGPGYLNHSKSVDLRDLLLDL